MISVLVGVPGDALETGGGVPQLMTGGKSGDAYNYTSICITVGIIKNPFKGHHRGGCKIGIIYTTPY